MLPHDASTPIVCPVRPFCVKHFTADATEDAYKSCRSHAIDFRAL